MKKLTSILRHTNTIAILYFLLLPGISVSQLDLILHEVDPGYAANHIAEDYEGNTIVCGNTFIGKLGENQTHTSILLGDHFENGIYFIQVERHGETQAKQFIIVK